MRFRPIHVVLIAAVACAAPAAAQTTPAPAAAQAIIAPSHLQAAQRLLVVTRSRDLMKQTAETAFMAQIRQDPAAAAQADVFREVFMQVAPWDEMLAASARLYAEMFTEAEINAAIAFHESPAGRRFAELGPTLAERSSWLGEEAMQRRLPELMRRLQERLSATGKNGESR
ncbi:MAG TPA: DUF2059 domain-containing protein [Longimicrobium sp.]|nr:DUF2059 domain-containing protein [Longimicrobium sp.]